MYKYNNILDAHLTDENYGMEGDFFVTINANDILPSFSKIAKGKNTLTHAGKIIKTSFLQMEKHFLNLKIQEYIIMPNHIHAIIHIAPVSEDPFVVKDISRFEVSFGFMVGRLNPFLLKGSIFHAISWFKSSSMIELRRKGFPDFLWKPGYFDFSISNNTSYKNIQRYILQDPSNWPDDIDNPENNFREFIYPACQL